MYKRKTYDLYEVQTNYGYGWEAGVSEFTFAEAKQRKKEYMQNARGLQGIRIVKRRVPIDDKQV